MKNKSKNWFVKPQNIVELGYDKICKTYHKKRKLEGNKRLLADLSNRLKRKSKILDAGCGGGFPVAKFLANEGFDIIGIDISSNMLKLARKNVPNAKFYKMDMTSITFPQESFEGITCFYAIIHVPRKFHMKILNKFYKLLKAGGFLLISVGSAEGFEKGIEDDWMGATMFWSQFDKKTNLKMIQDAGFTIISLTLVGKKNDRHLFVLAQKKTKKTA